MSDPLQDVSYNVTSPHTNSLKFAKLHSPRMKSVYWRYFGYPTNEDDCIITKQNVVCIICHKVLTNHGNTTNLRAHLQYRHKEIFNKIITENHITLPQRKVHPKQNVNIKRESIERTKVKTEYLDTSQDANMSANSCEEQAVLYESVVPMTYDDDEVIDNNHFIKVEVNAGIDLKAKPFQPICENSNDHNDKYLRGGNNQIVDTYQLQEALTNLVIQDMLNIETIYETGMAQLLKTLSSNAMIPPSNRLESFIREMYSDKHTSIADEIKMHSQTKAFSLGFELWSNLEHRQFLSIYYNYTTDAPEYNLINQLYCTLEYNKFSINEEVFENFNMQNCTAAIVNNDCDTTLSTFLKNKNIPLILAYDVIVDCCLKDVFALPAVAAIIEEVKEVMIRYHLEINSKDVDIPRTRDDFPWTYYELLKYFTERMPWSDDFEVLMASAKAVVDCLKTLSVILDTLKGEEIPLSSMLLPITSKVLNKKLTVAQDDDKFVAAIKTIITKKLKELVLSDDHLTISALLDPRFHRLITIDNINVCLKILSEKFHRVAQVQDCESKTVTVGDSRLKMEAQRNVKKSNLELFFDLTDPSMSLPVHNANSVDSDLKRYRAEVYVNLDESPFLWWHKMGHLYNSLKYLASMYQCVPCTVNMDFKNNIKQQIMNHQKRSMLSGNLVDAILFLHHNK